MKAIVAKVLFGSILGCLSWTSSVRANPQITHQSQLEVPTSPIIISAKLLSSDKLPIVPQIINIVDRIFRANKSDNFNLAVDREAQIIFRDRFSLNLDRDRSSALDQPTYTHQDRQANMALGFQKTFWPSENKAKYWGVTTVEYWGSDRQQQLNIAKLNYTNLAPTLETGNSALTVSGGGNNNLVKETHTSKEFEEFRGGVTYHHGVVDDVTMGVGFVYEDFLVGFTQLTYDSDLLPLRTTVSILAKESGVDFRSHVRFEPIENFVLNYYHEPEKNQFDANWKLISGLTLTAKGDSQKDSLSTGIEIAVHNEYMSISAKAALNNNDNLQWKLNSQIGSFKFAHNSNDQKSNSEVDLKLLESNIGFQCSAFFKYQTRQVKQSQEQFTVWGGKLHSTKKITPNQHLWTVNLGFGSGYHGNGLIASGSIALKPNMSFKLTYEEISATSDDTDIKLELSYK